MAADAQASDGTKFLSIAQGFELASAIGMDQFPEKPQEVQVALAQ
jgi:hypothetical protein